MKIISLFQILEMHRQIIAQSGGTLGIRVFLNGYEIRASINEQEELFLNFPKTSRWIPSASFAAYYASPQFNSPETSDGSNGTFYLSGLISFY